MCEQHHVHVFEDALAHQVSLAAQQLFGDARPKLDRPRKLGALHQPFDGNRRGDVERLARVMTFTVAGCAFDHRVVIGDAGFLRGLRDAIDVRAERNDRLARSPGRHPGGWDAGDAALNAEALFFEDVGQILRGLELLKAKLAEAEDHIIHDLGLLLHRLDIAVDLRFVILCRIRLRMGGPRQSHA